MRTPPGILFRGVLKFAVVVLAATAVGAGLGVGLAALSGDDGPSPVPVTTSASTSTSPAQTTAATPAQGSRSPRVRVLSAVLFPSATASGRARRRARLSVRVRVTNRDSATLAAQDPQLLVDTRRISTDPRADSVAGPLLESLAPAASAAGELRFETTGAVTGRLHARPSARLRIAHRTVAVKITISPTPAPAG